MRAFSNVTTLAGPKYQYLTFADLALGCGLTYRTGVSCFLLQSYLFPYLHVNREIMSTLVTPQSLPRTGT